MNSYDIAVLTALSELGKRYGLEPYDLDANIQAPDSGPEVKISFDKPPNGDKSQRYWRMMSDLGISDQHGPQLTGTEEIVWTTVQAALKRAPNSVFRA